MAIESQGAKLEISGSTGAAVETMTATAGNPTILTKENHGLTNGTIGTLSAFAGADAALMNDKVVTVKYATDDTFAVDIDTTGKTLTAANGTITPLAYLEVGEITDFDGPSGSASVIDTTNLQSTAKESLWACPTKGSSAYRQPAAGRCRPACSIRGTVGTDSQEFQNLPFPMVPFFLLRDTSSAIPGAAALTAR
jgi:hypothetical protein